MLLIPFVKSYGINSEEDKVSKPFLFMNDDQYGLTLNSNSSFALPAPAKNVSYPSQGLVLLLTPTYSAIYNKEAKEDNNLNLKSKLGFNMELGYFIKLNRLLSVGAGIGYSAYNTEVSSASYTEQSSTEDNGQQLINYVEIDQLFEELNVSYIDIPIYIEVGNFNIDKVGFYGRLGLKTSINISSSFEGEGTYSSWGDYPLCSVTLYDIPELGYYTKRSIYNNLQEIKIKSTSFSLLLSGGITFPVSSYIIIKAGVNLNLGLTSIAEDNSANSSAIDNHWEYSRILNNSSSSTLRSYGIEIGLIYNLRLY